MYWTLDTRPPTLDERIFQAKARHAERVEQIAAEEPVPQIEVPDVPRTGTIQVGPTFTVRPGEYFEVSEAQLKAYQERMRREALSRMAAQQNMGMGGGLIGDPSPMANPWYAAQQGLNNLGGLTNHPFLRF